MGKGEKNSKSVYSFITGDDTGAIGVTAAPDARVHTPSQGRLRGAPVPFHLPSSPLSLHICDWQLSQRRGWRQDLSPRRRLWVKSDTLKDEGEREKNHISVQGCTLGHCFIAVIAGIEGDPGKSKDNSNARKHPSHLTQKPQGVHGTLTNIYRLYIEA